MAGDYARRIVARLSGMPAVAAAPLMAPRGAAEATSDEANPFEAPRGVAASASDAPPATRERSPAADPSTVAASPREGFATHRESIRTASSMSPPSAPVTTHEVTTRSVVERERIVEHVVREREAAAAVPIEAREHARRRTEDDSVTDRASAAQGARSTTDEDSSGERRVVDRSDAMRRTHPRVEAAGVEGPRRESTSSAESRVSRRGPPRREHAVPIRPRPAAQPSPVVRVTRERPRLIIGRLVVEVVPPPAAAAARVVTRVAAAPPRPFRAQGPSSLALGPGFGLGQG